jgi:hypothetical protein
MKVDKNLLAAIEAGKAYEKSHNVEFNLDGKAVFITAYLTGLRDALKWVNDTMEG